MSALYTRSPLIDITQNYISMSWMWTREILTKQQKAFGDGKFVRYVVVDKKEERALSKLYYDWKHARSRTKIFPTTEIFFPTSDFYSLFSLPNIPFLSDWKAQVVIYGRSVWKALCNLREMLGAGIFPSIRHVKLCGVLHGRWRTVLLKRSLKKDIIQPETIRWCGLEKHFSSDDGIAARAEK